MAAQVVSGIGFLGSGIILRDGLSVRGLNTAATLWCSAAVAALAGAGIYPIAAVGTAAVITANVALRPLGQRLDRQPNGDAEIAVDYRFSAACTDSAEAHLRALLVQALTGTDFGPRAIRSYDTDTDPQVRVTAKLTAGHRDDRQLDAAVSRLGLEPAATAVSGAVTTTTEPPDPSEDSDPLGDTLPDKDPNRAVWRLRSPVTRQHRSPAPTPPRVGTIHRGRMFGWVH